jgi:hypothetical protein
MKIVDSKCTGYSGSHTVFEHAYSGSHHHRAQFAVRRVNGHGRDESQIEVKLESTPQSYGGKATRTSTQRMSLCIPPAEAVALAAAICPELAEVARLLIRGDGTNLQAVIDAALKVIDHIPAGEVAAAYHPELRCSGESL